MDLGLAHLKMLKGDYQQAGKEEKTILEEHIT